MDYQKAWNSLKNQIKNKAEFYKGLHEDRQDAYERVLDLMHNTEVDSRHNVRVDIRV